MSVSPQAVGTYIGSIILTTDVPETHITIPISVNVMQIMEATTVTDIAGTVDEVRDVIYYTLDVEPGLARLSLSLDWTNPDNELGLLLFNPDGELVNGWWYWWEPMPEIEVALPQEGKWTVVIMAWWLVTLEETYSLWVGALYLELGKGWNIVSTPIALHPDYDTWGEFIALGDGLAVDETTPAYYFDSLNQVWHVVLADYRLKSVDAIYVKMAEADKAPIVPSPYPSVPAKRLYPGWNLVGLAALEDMQVNRALTSIYLVLGDRTGYSQVVSPPLHQLGWIYVRDDDNRGLPIPLMQVGKGYWVFMINPGTLAGFIFTPIIP
jgi:hypothetical protein